jgi:hypothetical protein
MRLSQSAAEAVAIAALTFIASDDELLSRFVAMTGIDPAAVRSELEKPDFLHGVMHHVVEHEDLLVAFASSAGLKPEQVAAAAQALGVRWD